MKDITLDDLRGMTRREMQPHYRALAKRLHPDAGGTAAEFDALQQIYENAPRTKAAIVVGCRVKCLGRWWSVTRLLKGKARLVRASCGNDVGHDIVKWVPLKEIEDSRYGPDFLYRLYKAR
jgi:hypothetical protein